MITVLENIMKQNRFFKRAVSMLYLILIDILILNSNVWLVMSQGLSRYDKKGEILLVYYFCKLCYPISETKTRHIDQPTQNSYSHKYPIDVDLGQIEVLKTLKNIKSADEGCAIKCIAACEGHAGKLGMIF